MPQLIAEALLGSSGYARPDGPCARGLNSEIVGTVRVQAHKTGKGLSHLPWVLPLLTYGYSYIEGLLWEVSEF
jgi:hypothetical protein